MGRSSDEWRERTEYVARNLVPQARGPLAAHLRSIRPVRRRADSDIGRANPAVTVSDAG